MEMRHQSWDTLYNSVSNLNSFWSGAGKQNLLNLRSSFETECRKLKINLDTNADPTKYYICQKWHPYGSSCSDCEKPSHAIYWFQGFTKMNTAYLISDDMRMVPNVVGSIIQTLGYLGINDIDEATQRNVTLGFKEIMDLLKSSLQSQTSLTDIILHKRPTTDSFNAVEKCKSATLLNKIEKEAALPNSEKKMSLEVMVQKSTNNLLFAQAKDDFVDFLFSFLTIPLGRVECLLGSDTRLKNIDNLYRSAANLDKNLNTQRRGNSILNPEIPKMYLCEDQFLPLPVERNPPLYYYIDGHPSYSIHPNGKRSCVTETGMYMVTDDLSVTPLCMVSSLNLLKEFKIPLSDVEELTVDLGLNEALNILKASLTSTCALTVALNSMLRKQPKQEPPV